MLTRFIKSIKISQKIAESISKEPFKYIHVALYGVRQVVRKMERKLQKNACGLMITNGLALVSYKNNHVVISSPQLTEDIDIEFIQE